MGLQMAARLQQHLSKHGEGRKLISWNRTQSKADPLREQGAQTVQHAAGRVPSVSQYGRLTFPVMHIVCIPMVFGSMW